jgi:hypothetical protein
MGAAAEPTPAAWPVVAFTAGNAVAREAPVEVFAVSAAGAWVRVILAVETVPVWLPWRGLGDPVRVPSSNFRCRWITA